MKQSGPYSCEALSLSALALFWLSQVRMVELVEWIPSGFITRLIPVGSSSKPCKALAQVDLIGFTRQTNYQVFQNVYTIDRLGFGRRVFSGTKGPPCPRREIIRASVPDISWKDGKQRPAFSESMKVPSHDEGILTRSRLAVNLNLRLILRT